MVELLRPTQVAAELKVSADTVRNWIRNGELSSVILGNAKVRFPHRRVSRDDLNAFIESRKDKTIEPRAKPAPRAKKYVPVCLK